MTSSKVSEAAPHQGRHSARKKETEGKRSHKKRHIDASQQDESFTSDSGSLEKAPAGPPPNIHEGGSESHEPAETDAEILPSKRKKSRKTHTTSSEEAAGDIGGCAPQMPLSTTGNDSAEAATEEKEQTAEDNEGETEKEDTSNEVIVYRENEIIDSSQSFKDLAATHLDRRLTKSLIDDLKLQHPTHVQSKVIPFALSGRDLLIESRTGSGKTLAYVLPLLQRLLQLQQQQQQRGETTGLPPLCALILVPTKELCIQVYDVLTALLKYTKDVVTVSHTASPSGGPGKLLGPPTVMIGTPTGVLHYLESLRQQQQRFDVQLFLEMLVVDEADLLFAFGFEKDTKKLLQLLPSTAAGHYQTILVSATQNHDLSQLQHLMLHKPLIIRIEEQEGARGGAGCANPIGEFYFQVPTEAEKWLVAYAFLRLGLVPLKCLVFCKDVSNVYALRLFLDRFGIASGVLSQTLPIAAREQQIQAFNQGLIDILITNDGQYMEEDNPQKETDASESAEASVSNQPARNRRRVDASKSKEAEFAGHRGLDLQGVACVFNFDAPNSFKSYIHRIGRTGRGGAAGVAVTLIDTSQEEQQLLLQQMFTMRKAPGALGEGDSTLTPLSLQLHDVECFRYRVEDVRRGITKRVIAAAVARDLQQQLLNSRKLKEFFERNPRDREVLKRACKQLKEMNVSKGTLGHLPDYLLSQTRPTQMTAIQLAIQQQTAGTAVTKGSHSVPRRRPVTDPLKSFKAAVTRGAFAGKRKAGRRPVITRQSQLAKMPKHPDELPPECLPATSGRKLWKLKHNKRVAAKEPRGNFLRKRSIKGLRKK